eukprot:TRINITY_DN9429_c0_g1_i1.p1 TRINITY_DN9429_c0_g1~~TRINITY_DN9429_c0_g1_i1.p1  ORF type:complete len:545 (-),score=47.12 TRINITY_DN9429_c0_g1_i1:40-1674(-)
MSFSLYGAKSTKRCAASNSSSSSKSGILAERSNYQNPKSSFNMIENGPAKNSQEEEKVLKFLDFFNKKPDSLISTFHDFERFYFETKPRLSAEIIKVLFYGDKRNKGLLHFCGKVDDEESHLVCSVGLNVLCRLLEFEYNKEAELFLKVYVQSNPKLLSLLQFSKHITGGIQRSCKPSALKLFHLYKTKNPNLSESIILDDEEAVREYEKWARGKQVTYKSAEHINGERTSSFDDEPIVEEDHNAKTLTHKLSNPLNDSHKLSSPLSYNSNGSGSREPLWFEQPKLDLFSWLDDKNIRWEVVYPGKHDTTGLPIKIKHSKGIMIKMSFTIKSNPGRILDAYANKRNLWDSKFVEYKELEQVDADTSIICAKFKWPVANQTRLLVVYTERNVQKTDYGYMMQFSTVKRDSTSLQRDECLGKLLFAIRISRGAKPKPGLEFKGEPDEEVSYCKVKVLQKNLNNNAILYMSSDLLGESKSLVDSIAGLIRVSSGLPISYPAKRAQIHDSVQSLSLIHISEPTRLGMISYAVFCLKKKKIQTLLLYHL